MRFIKDDIPLRARVYISLVVTCGPFVVAYCLFKAFTSNPLTWLLLAGITAIGSFIPIGIPYSTGCKGQSIKITVSDVFIFVAIILYSPEVAVCMALIDGCLGSIRIKTFYRVAYNLSQMALVTFLVGHLFYRLQGQHPPLSATSVYTPLLFLNLGLCAFLFFILNTGSIALAISLVTRNRILEVWKQNFLWGWVTNLAGALAAAVIFLNFGQMQFFSFGIAIPVVIVIYHAYRMNQHRILMQQESERFQSTLDALCSHVALLDDCGRIITVNAAWRQFAHAQHLFGPDFGVGVNYLKILETPAGHRVKESMALASGLREVLGRQRDEFYMECPLHSLDEKHWFAIRATRFGGDGPGRVVVAQEDITARKLAEEALRLSEEQLRQSQKMEAVGVLAGGIAHDFRNLLMVILGYSDLISGSTPEGDSLHDAAEEITRAANSASTMTRQLLAFSRKELVQPRVINLNTTLSEMEKMLERLIGEDIELATILRPDLWPVKADPGQIEQVVMNLAVNSRDAMPNGGKLIIETDNVELDQMYEQVGANFQPGSYAMLAVSDSGCGIDKETVSRIFEPFFTTKEVGKGTGLGLATVYGIVKQSGGQIYVYSEPELGSTFKIYLPRYSEAVESAEEGNTHSASPPGSETVLLVEDEEKVRQIVRLMLEKKGYNVLEASQAIEALAVSETFKGPIHLMITDIVMPHMKGYELAERMAPLRPDTRVLFISGFTGNGLHHASLRRPDTAFLHKPFTLNTLAHKVRVVLDDDAPCPLNGEPPSQPAPALVGLPASLATDSRIITP
jgi:signal transduction histidine kinase/ActR/RegA family two-component response regulator